MPPRIPPPRRVLGPSPSLCLLSGCTSGPASSPAAALRLLLGGRQARHASRLIDTLRNNPGSTRNRKRVGRGPSSGYGKTSGRGHKGTGQRGKVNPWFQGGQTPLIVSLGRKGFENIRAPQMAEVNLDSIQAWINRGRLDPSRPITPRELIRARLAKLMDGVKLLARGGGGAGRKSGTVLRQPIDVVVSRASQAAIAAVEAAGGRVVTRYYTRDSIRRLLSGESENTALPLPLGPEHVPAALASTRREDGGRLYRLPDPTSRREVEYYRDPSHRGYLAAGLRVGETPSLYHRIPKPIDDTELARLMKIRAAKLKEKRKDRKHDARVF